ncbi:MAG: hypothetical protein DLM50_04285 [Candidatus Meridianibacter frigidus]|nr:MAG: hypothetical protein DLM50_04285 [Candidatus Eremiobacteraeota bacterium]
MHSAHSRHSFPPRCPAQNAPAPAPAPTGSPAATGGDIILDATVHIDRLRYDTTPQKANVRLSGVRNCSSAYTARRINLPEHPKPGVTYRNVTIVLHAAGSVTKDRALIQCSPS